MLILPWSIWPSLLACLVCCDIRGPCNLLTIRSLYKLSELDLLYKIIVPSNLQISENLTLISYWYLILIYLISSFSDKYYIFWSFNVSMKSHFKRIYLWKLVYEISHCGVCVRPPVYLSLCLFNFFQVAYLWWKSAFLLAEKWYTLSSQLMLGRVKFTFLILWI